MKKVLILTYYWPPAGGPGVQRILKFTKFLPEFGWEPHVITPMNGSYPNLDESLLQDIHIETRIYKTKTFEPFALYNKLTGKKGKTVPVAMTGFKDKTSFIQRLAKYIRANYFIPDARKGWNRYAYRTAAAVIKVEKPDVIISTGPPQSTHLCAMKLSKKFNVPWVADFRDPWTTVYYNQFFPRSKKTKAKDLALETQVLETADVVTVISKGLQDEFAGRVKESQLIYNGYDEDDIAQVSSEEQEKFTISYIGNFKPNQKVTQFWQALYELMDESLEFRENIEVCLVGSQDSHIQEEVNKRGLQHYVKMQGFVNHSEATRLMQKASALLFIIPQSENNKLILTGKIFEYLASRVPIISIGPVEGNANELLGLCKRPSMVDYGDLEKIKARITLIFEEWKGNGKKPKSIENSDHEQFTRKNQAQKLAKILDKFEKATTTH